MSVTSVREVARGRRGDADDTGIRNYTRTWQIITDSVSDGVVTVGAHTDLPAVWAEYPDDTTALCLSLDINQTDDCGLVWEATAKYSSKFGQQLDPNPLLRAVKWSFDTTHYTRVVEKDIDGNAIKNSVGDWFDPPLEQEESRGVYRAVRNEAVLNPALFTDLENSVNSGGWKGFPALTVKLNKVSSGDLQTENGVEFYSVSYEFEVNPDTWDRDVLNRGYRAREVNGGLIKELPDKEPRNLDKDTGVILPKNQAGHYLTFKTRKRRDFNILGL